jgi:hypothetical protein
VSLAKTADNHPGGTAGICRWSWLAWTRCWRTRHVRLSLQQDDYEDTETGKRKNGPAGVQTPEYGSPPTHRLPSASPPEASNHQHSRLCQQRRGVSRSCVREWIDLRVRRVVACATVRQIIIPFNLRRATRSRRPPLSQVLSLRGRTPIHGICPRLVGMHCFGSPSRPWRLLRETGTSRAASQPRRPLSMNRWWHYFNPRLTRLRVAALWRRMRDSNSRGVAPNTLSKRAP